MTADQLRTRQRIEGLIRLMSPALDVVLAVGRADLAHRRTRGRRVLPTARHARKPTAAEEDVNREEQLQWEARWALPTAIAAFVAGAMLLVSGLLFIPKDRKGIEPTPDILLSIDEQSGAYLTSALLAAVASVFLIGVFLYLFRASVARGAAVPHWFVYLIVIGPILYAIATVVGALDAIDIADEFADGTPIRGQAGEDRATDLGGSSGLLVGLSTAGTVGMAFLFVMLPLRARRVGLLTPFMGILGVVAGALIVFRGQLPGLATVLQGLLARRSRCSCWDAGRAAVAPRGRAAGPSRGRRPRSGAARAPCRARRMSRSSIQRCPSRSPCRSGRSHASGAARASSAVVGESVLRMSASTRRPAAAGARPTNA